MTKTRHIDDGWATAAEYKRGKPTMRRYKRRESLKPFVDFYRSVSRWEVQMQEYEEARLRRVHRAEG